MTPGVTSRSVDPDAARPFGDVRLVRLRLTLALLAAALLPLAIIAPVLRIVGDGTQAAETTRLEASAQDAAAAIARDLDGTRRALALLAAEPQAIDVATAGAKPGDELRAAAATMATDTPHVLALAIIPGGAEPVVAWRRAANTEIGVTPRATLDRLVAGGPGAVVVETTGIDRRDGVALLVPVIDGGSVVGAMRADLALLPLLRSIADASWPETRTVALRAPRGGEPLAVLGGGTDVTSFPGEILGRAIDPAAGIDGLASAPIEARGFAGWTLEVTEPFVVSSIPLEAVAALATVAIAVVGLLVWMAHLVLRPAHALEANRDHLRLLYDTEREASLRDHLTGLGNHRAFQEELARQFDQSTRYRVPLALLTLDLDEFKTVNDTLGHGVGDDLLAEVGRVIRSTVRTADRAFRTGGDEFAVVMPHTDAAGGHELGQRLLRRMLDDRPGGRYPRPISFSAGVAAIPEHAQDRAQLLHRADAALYRSKRGGRTIVTLFDASVDRPALEEHERAELSARVARVAADRALRPVYQPIVHLATGRPVAYEGLVRPHPSSGFESPGALFAAAELSGRITELDRACLDVVVGGARDLPEDVFVSLNISPRTFEAQEFSAGAFLGILDRHRIAPGRVILELTEREAIEDLDRLRRALDACRAAGVQIAADDVGAGNAGLRLLSQIRFDVMKIDLSLVQAGAGREPVASVLTSLVDLARRWRALVVAEGVETPDQLRLIRGLGIDAAQGYLIGRPGPLEQPRTYDIDSLEASAQPDGLPWWAAGPPPGVSGSPSGASR